MVVVEKLKGTRAYKLSSGRFCKWFTKKELVDKIMNENRFINIDDQTIEIRRCKPGNTCDYIARVCVNTPLNHRECPPVSILRSNFERPEYRHIVGSRRQVYIPPDQQNLVPNSIKITHDETKYRIFLSMSEIMCDSCKEKGHTITHCPN